ncbi:M16 family metallopeptidase [Novosphingobium ginsenosidimutans]|nr:insulinase family protein [Novosphingobium ginsenosidimutans]
MSRKFLFVLILSTTALAACAPQQARLVSAAQTAKPTWAFEASDVPVEEDYKFGKLDNGLRYVIRSNAMPQGQALVRMVVNVGSLDEADDERGYAHYVEHMAFNGSTNVPEGEMIKLLERQGLAFGADTNASTGFERTEYKLDLPRNDPALLDTALMLMRETASELTISEAAVARERGVILSEKRDRNTFALRNFEDQMQFLHPQARYASRLPIGTEETLNAATAERLRAFWRREYVPAQTTLLVVGDFPVEAVEAAIKARFADWRPAPAEPQPLAGPFDPKAGPREDIFLDQALSERVTVSRDGPWLDEPDTLAQRRENLLRQIGYGIVNRRLLRRTREANAPFRGAGVGTSDSFREGRATNMIVETVDGGWKRGLQAATEEYRRALEYGFTQAEVAEQIANARTSARNAAASESTRSHGTLLGAVLALVTDDIVPDKPSRSLERLEAFIPEITPDKVLAALKRELVPLEQPLIRFQGRREPIGGTEALREAWDAAFKAKVSKPESKAGGAFAYTDFGPAGQVVSDVTEPRYGIRQLRFANGVMLNLKRTDLTKDRVLVRLSLDGGSMLATRDKPLAVQMMAVFGQGGLGKHSRDELDSLLAGRTVGVGLGGAAETFAAGATTTPADLELQLQVLAAQLTDPGYRPEGEVLYRQSINNLFAALGATPDSALSGALGGILSDNDPRFSLGKVEDYRKLTFAQLKDSVSDRLAKGAIELALVGDFDEARAIALVAKTLGALPPREATFQPYAEQRERSFTNDRSRRVLRHKGAKDQALLTLHWPTRDGEDLKQAIALDLLERVVQVELTDTLREALGKAYSPGVSANSPRVWRGYGTFALRASVDVKEVATTRAAMRSLLEELRKAPVSADVVQRARAPLLENLDAVLKTNAGWMSLADRVQSKPDGLDRFANSRAIITALTAADLLALARRYLDPDQGLEILVLPEGVEP